MTILRIAAFLPFLAWLGASGMAIANPPVLFSGPDRQVYRLAALEVVNKDALRPYLVNLPFDQVEAGATDMPYDRWGRRLVNLPGLGRMAIAQGWAICRPQFDILCRPDWLDAEEAAREQKTGIWLEQFPISIEKAGQYIGSYALVKGRILHAQALRRYVYLNFGKTWKTDFTIRVASEDAKKMAKDGVNLLALTGRQIEVRGVVFEENGPMIELRDIQALEILQ